jgi:hypothetical protein
MKLITGVAVAVLVLTVSMTAKAENFQAMAVCHEGTNSGPHPSYVNDAGLLANRSIASEFYCPLKSVVCSGGSNCTYSITAYGADSNSTNASDSNVICQLRLQGKSHHYVDVYGTAVTNSTANGTPEAMSLSVTASSGFDGWIYAHCVMGKNDPTTGAHSYMWAFLNSTNF